MEKLPNTMKDVLQELGTANDRITILFLSYRLQGLLNEKGTQLNGSINSNPLFKLSIEREGWYDLLDSVKQQFTEVDTSIRDQAVSYIKRCLPELDDLSCDESQDIGVLLAKYTRVKKATACCIFLQDSFGGGRKPHYMF